MEQITLRQWRDSDLEPYVAMNADPEVMRYFPSLWTHEKSEASLIRQRTLIEQRGWGFWVLDVDGTFAGLVGLAIPNFEASFMPCVEVGWRLRREYWGRGIAYRGALQALDYGFRILVNVRSWRLMERLAFVHDAANDFDHPSIAEGHELRRHVFYRRKA
jgi:RimJ/RimL family protein N-acetyltransferase